VSYHALTKRTGLPASPPGSIPFTGHGGPATSTRRRESPATRSADTPDNYPEVQPKVSSYSDHRLKSFETIKRLKHDETTRGRLLEIRATRTWTHSSSTRIQIC